MKTALCTASPTAIVAAIAGLAWAGQATAQPASTARAPAQSETAVEELVVTGSLIRGTPLDAALPVEVHTQEELEKQGSPTALEFAKTLTISGPTTGEAYYFGGVPPGSVSYNLRGIGTDKTLTLLNGRRVSENASNIPFMALDRTEILKDGAAVTYGADATGGVVNFITKRRYVGLETSGTYKAIRGSTGDYTFGVLAGVGEGDVNLLVSAEYEHRSRLSALDRGFAKKSLDPTDPNYNPAPWSTLTNLAGWLPRGALPAVPSATANGEWGNPVAGIVSDFNAASCAAVGGRFDNSFTCAYNYIPYYNIVETSTIYRAYAQLNAKVNDWLDAHVEVSYGQVDDPQIFGSPAQPVTKGPALATGATYQFYVPRTNPFAAAFAAANNVTPAAQGFTPVTYRALAHGGNLFLGEGHGFGVPSRYNSQVFRVSSELKGRFGDVGGLIRNAGYNMALTYNHGETYADSPDVLGFRLQEALNGFGGPNCKAADLNPARFGTQNPAAAGTNGCLYWNPFSSGFANQPARGLANPNYVAGTENPEALVRWLFDPRATETTTQSLTFDLVFDGATPIALPGGDVAVAVGFQARSLESREDVQSDLYNGNTPCPWPDGFTSANGAGSPNLEANPAPTQNPEYRGCTADSPGPFVFFGTNPPDHNDLQNYSFFGELQVPVLDTLDFQLAVRHEEFSGNLKATVYKVSGKWNVFGPLTLRGSYGTNYQAPPLGTRPGEVVNAVRNYTIAAANWLGAQFITAPSLKPETAKAWNVGVIWQSQGLASDHDFRLIVDYFNIKTKDEIGQLADPNQIANLIFNGPAAAGFPSTTGTITTCDPAAQPLLNRIIFNNGCSVGLTSVGSFSQISTVVGNGPGQHTNGFDIQATYHLPLWEGDLTLGAIATRITKLTTGPTSLDGVVISTGDDRLGTLNFQTVAFAAPKWRANFSANYAMGPHNLRLGVNYVSAVKDERAGVQYGENGREYITTDLTYRVQLPHDFTVTATVANLFDRNPPPAQEELGYDPRLGDPLGRTFEIGLKKIF